MPVDRSPTRPVWRWCSSVLSLALVVGVAACGTDPVQPTMRVPDAGRPLMQVGATPSVYTQVVAATLFTCMVRSDGIIDCLGGSFGTLSIKPTVGSFEQVALFARDHGCALRTDGVVECFGSNAFLQSPASRAATGGGRYTQVGVGKYHSCALRTDGVVECWGSNEFGQAPAERAASSSGTYFTQLSSGSYFNCAVRNDGVVECWGYGAFSATPAFTKQAAIGSFVQVSSGDLEVCAVRVDGVVECWSLMGYDLVDATRPASTGRFVQVSMGKTFFACALRDDGQVECWGDANDEAQAPALKSAAVGRYVAVTTGTSHACALRDDGAIECWGDNGGGRAPALRVAPNYVLSGFEAPVDNAPTVNVAKAGRVIPVKWRMLDVSGSPVLDLSSADMQFIVAPLACQAGLPSAPVESATTLGGPGLQNLGGGYYQLNWATAREWGGTCKTIELRFWGGKTQMANFDFTK